MSRFETVNGNMLFSVAYLQTERLVTFCDDFIILWSIIWTLQWATNTYLVLRMSTGTNDLGAVFADVGIGGGSL